MERSNTNNMIGKLILLFLINSICLFVVGRFVPGFVIPAALAELAVIALIFTGLNLILKPILKLILTPVIWLSLGLANLALNALMLIILDKISEMVIISGVVPLVLGTLIITVTNAICQRLLLPKS